MSNTKMNKDIVPDDFTIGLVIVDMIPVLLFGSSGFIFGLLAKNILISIGASICFLSGFLKVWWKLIVVIKKRNVWFLFMQMRIVMPIGFLMFVIGIVIASIIGNMVDVLRGCMQFPQVILFTLGFIGMGLMGYFAKNLDSTDVKSNWIEQITNSVAQLFIFIGLLMLIF